MSRFSEKNRRESHRDRSRRRNVFSEYRRRTGSWPALSMALYAGRFALMMAAIIFLFWYNQKHSDELMKTMAYFLIATLPVAILWTVAETVAWNYDLRRKGLISKGKVYGVRQLPPE